MPSSSAQFDYSKIWPPYSTSDYLKAPLSVTHGKEEFLYTADGRKIFDAISSWWVTLHGHANTHIADAIAKQAHLLEQVIFSGFMHEPAARLSHKLCEVLPNQPAKIFFSDNGSTAVEVALKTAFILTRKRKQKPLVLAFEGAYHGDTFGAMSVSGRSVFNNQFSHLLFETKYIQPPLPGRENECFNQLRNLLPQAGCMILEPLVMGAGGMKMYDRKHLDQILAMCRQHHVVAIADEVFTGFGRTGNLFASTGLKHQPDIICLSKGLSGGFMPMGATAFTSEIISEFGKETLYHGHSFTGNPLSCAAANASLDLLLQNDTLSQIEKISALNTAAVSQLKNQRGIKDARSCGTILAIESEADESYTNPTGSEIYEYFLSKNMLIRPLGNVIYMVPPLCTDPEIYKQAIKELLNFTAS